MIYTELAFWKASAERAIKTAAQTAVALIGTDQVGILNLDWGEIGAVVATATVLSVLTSVASGVGGSPAIGNTERLDVPTVVGDYSGADANVSWGEVVEDEPDEVVGDDVEYVEPLTDAEINGPEH